MNDTWIMFTWENVNKMLFLIFAIVVFTPILYFLILPSIGAYNSIIVYFIFIFFIGFLIRIWGKKKLKK